MRSLLLAIALFAWLPLAHAGTPEPGFSDASVISGLSAPTAIAFMPDGRMLVTQKGGALLLVDSGVATNLVTIPVCADSEMGLLGIALDPSFSSNGFIYLYRTKQGTMPAPPCGNSLGDRVNEVVRVTMTPSDTVSIGSLVVLLTGIRTDGGNHDGGVLRIGTADNKLYVGAGDTGNGDNHLPVGSSTNPYAGDLNALEGKILRLNLDGTPPADNPYFGQVGKRGEIFAYGFRNPFRMSFDPMTDALWVADVGDLTWEELDIVTSGDNYSWPQCEGTEPSGCPPPGEVPPIFTYPHSGGSSLGRCIIGGSFAGAAFGGAAGNYVFGDCVSSNVYLATLNGAHTDISGTPALISSGAGTPADFVTGPDGAVYYTAEGDGEVRRVALESGDQELIGRKLVLREHPPDDTKKRLAVVSRDQTITLGLSNNSVDDPVMHGGSLRVVSSAGDTFDATYTLPSGNWSYVGNAGDNRGYKYKDRFLAASPIKVGKIRPGRSLKFTGKGNQLTHTLGTDPNPVSLVLTLGTQRYCMTFDGDTKFVPTRKYRAVNAAPGACPP